MIEMKCIGTKITSRIQFSKW